MSTGTTGIPDEVPDWEPIQIIRLAGIVVGMILLLYLLRRVINIFVIDVCILGDCTALKNILCWKKRDDYGAGTNGPRQWRSQDAIDLQTIGAFSDPVAYLYNDIMEEGKRKQFLDVITDTELLSTSEERRDTANHEEIDSSGKDTAKDNDNDNDKDKDDDNDEESNIKEHEHHESVAEEDRPCCSICLQELESDQCKIRKCKHAFHKTCIKSWISRSLSCPVCREEMVTRDRLRDYMSANQHLMSVES